jgi:hypothetical protein
VVTPGFRAIAGGGMGRHVTIRVFKMETREVLEGRATARLGN